MQAIETRVADRLDAVCGKVDRQNQALGIVGGKLDRVLEQHAREAGERAAKEKMLRAAGKVLPWVGRVLLAGGGAAVALLGQALFG